MEKKIRLLRADEIECRASSVSEKGVILLLYKDARVDQRILDETFGLFGWKRSHQCMDGNLYCTVEVYDKENGCWVAKQDVGTVGNYEKEKSQASDSFKRACFNWGIGRELYSAPFIWVPAKDTQIQKKDGKPYCYDRFSVSTIAYNDHREISMLMIVNDSQNGKNVYEFYAKGKQNQHSQVQEGITEQQVHSFQSELQRTGVDMDTVKNRYGFDKPQHMTEELYNRVMKALGKTKSAGSAA